MVITIQKTLIFVTGAEKSLNQIRSGTGHGQPGWKTSGQGTPYGMKPGKLGHFREEKNIVMIGIILVCAVVVAGIDTYFGVSHVLNRDETAQ